MDQLVRQFQFLNHEKQSGCFLLKRKLDIKNCTLTSRIYKPESS
jgi:hypothetical protein